MSKKVWVFAGESNHHIVELNYNRLTSGGNVIVDGAPICKWGWCLKSKDVPIEVGNKKAVLKLIVNHLSRNRQELHADGIVM